MELLTRHWEKVVLTATLLVVISTGGWLLWRIDYLTQEWNNARLIATKGPELTPVDIGPYDRAVAELSAPPLWSAEARLPFERPGTKSGTEWKPPEPPVPTNTLVRVDQRPFEMTFLAYVGDGQDFQINLRFFQRTFFVAKVGDPIRQQFGKIVYDTGYVVSGFTKKFATVDSSVGQQEVDVSEITLQRRDHKPVTLVYGKPSLYPERTAVVECDTRIGRPTYFTVRINDTYACGPKKYKVIDITSDQMLIIEEDKPDQTIVVPLKSTRTGGQTDGGIEVPDGLISEPIQ